MRKTIPSILQLMKQGDLVGVYQLNSMDTGLLGYNIRPAVIYYYVEEKLDDGVILTSPGREPFIFFDSLMTTFYTSDYPYDIMYCKIPLKFEFKIESWSKVKKPMLHKLLFPRRELKHYIHKLTKIFK